MTLQGTCFEYTDNEYTYKMCPFDMCSQRGKSGGAETRLGGWGEWTGPEHDRSVVLFISTARPGVSIY